MVINNLLPKGFLFLLGAMISAVLLNWYFRSDPSALSLRLQEHRYIYPRQNPH